MTSGDSSRLALTSTIVPPNGENRLWFALIVSSSANSSPAASFVPTGFTWTKATSPLRCWRKSVSPTRTPFPSDSRPNALGAVEAIRGHAEDELVDGRFEILWH